MCGEKHLVAPAVVRSLMEACGAEVVSQLVPAGQGGHSKEGESTRSITKVMLLVPLLLPAACWMVLFLIAGFFFWFFSSLYWSPPLPTCLSGFDVLAVFLAAGCSTLLFPFGLLEFVNSFTFGSEFWSA